MNPITRYLPKLNDRNVVLAFQAVAEKYKDHGAQLLFGDALGQLAESDINQFIDFSGFSLSNATIRIKNVTWQWVRLFAEHNDPKSANYDKLTWSFNAQQGQPERALCAAVNSSLSDALARPLLAVEDDTSICSDPSSKEVLLALEGAVAKVIVDTNEYRRALDISFSEKEEALSKKFAEVREHELREAREERERISREIEARNAVLDERQAELDKRKKALDDRDNTHVRREIRTSLLQLAKDRLDNFTVSKQTRRQYVAIHLVSILGVALLVAGSAWYGSMIVENGKDGSLIALVTIITKSSLLALGAVTLGGWYLKWLSKWFQRISEAEFRLQQFRLDIERASWLAETVLEWRSSSGEPFPELLTSRLSAGLFVSQETGTDDAKSPASQLADALFGSASSVKVKVGQQELTLDRKSIKSLQE